MKNKKAKCWQCGQKADGFDLDSCPYCGENDLCPACQDDHEAMHEDEIQEDEGEDVA